MGKNDCLGHDFAACVFFARSSNMKIFLILLASVLTASAALSEKELESIGRRVWKNECGGTRDGLTSWNVGEDFASLGIGHFIWYPRGASGPFEESFPKLVRALRDAGVKVPAWLRDGADCPWSTRAEFQKDFHSVRMNELRDMLAATVPQQSRFLAQRMDEALPKMVAAAPGGQRDKIRENFRSLAATGAGTFALIDYVNFKGEGTKPEERYKGEGWGLLQVLAGMRGSSPEAFAASAANVLERRVKNSPPDRNESRWLAGWKSRVRAYGG